MMMYCYQPKNIVLLCMIDLFDLLHNNDEKRVFSTHVFHGLTWDVANHHNLTIAIHTMVIKPTIKS